MALHGYFGDTNCMGVTGKDGKTIWIFKLEDLREVVPQDVYEVIEAIVNTEKENAIDEWINNKEKVNERIEDGYFGICNDTRIDLGEVLEWLKSDNTRLNKKELIRRLEMIHLNLDLNI